MSYDGNMTTVDRPTLTRERVILAAVAYADAHGVESMSMRKLGAELGVEAMSLYNHVDNKDDLYDGMIDNVFESIELSDDDDAWQDQLRRIGTNAMDRFAEHAWVVTLLMTRGNYGPGALRFMDHVLGLLLEAGFSADDAHHAWQMLASHTMGYAFQAANAEHGAFSRDDDEVQRLLAMIGPEFPNVARLAPTIAACEFSEEYKYAFEIIIDGLEAQLARSS